MKTFFLSLRSDLVFAAAGLIRFAFSVTGILATGMVLAILFLSQSEGLTAGEVLVGMVEITGFTSAAAASVALLKLVLLVAGVIYDATRNKAPSWRA